MHIPQNTITIIKETYFSPYLSCSNTSKAPIPARLPATYSNWRRFATLAAARRETRYTRVAGLSARGGLAAAPPLSTYS